MYAIIRKVFKFRTCGIETISTLFDKMVLPVATYNCEVWGTMCFPLNKKNNFFIHTDNRKNPVEDLQIKFCKRLLLGVSDKTSNWAATSEIGRHSTIIIIITNMIKFWSHLTQSNSPIVRAALRTNMELAQVGYRSWFSYVHRLLVFLDLEHLIYTSDLKEINYQLSRLKSRLHMINFGKPSELN